MAEPAPQPTVASPSFPHPRAAADFDAILALRYQGAAVDNGTMNVYDAAANMIAFSEFVVAATKATYGEAVTARVSVSGFGKGSFLTTFVVDLAGVVATVFSVASPADIIKTIKEAFELWKHLKGIPPREVTQGDNFDYHITNYDGQVLVVKDSTVNLVFSEKGSQTVERFVRDAVGKDGIDRVEVTDASNKLIASASESEAPVFLPVAPEQPVSENKVVMHLMIEAAVFKDGNKWRFSDGTTSFYADIEDSSFLSQVNEGEAFAKGDIMKVEMVVRQSSIGGRISTERIITHVIEHRSRPTQGSLIPI